MQKVSIKKISILGLVLMAAAAITAAVSPSKSGNKLNRFVAGSLTNYSAIGNVSVFSSITCAPDSFGFIENPCNFSDDDDGQIGCGLDSETTGGCLNYDSTSIASLSADGGAGQDNTSDNS